MEKRKEIGIIFDLDGTLWDSSKQVVDSWNIALKDFPEIDYKIKVEDMHRNMGKILPEIGKNLFVGVDDKKREEILEHCCAIENDYIRKVGGDLFQGAVEMFQSLSDKYSVFIVSNCQAGYIEAFLDHYEFHSFFTDTECPGNTGLPKGDNIKLIIERNQIKQAVYIGDTYGDYNAAVNVAKIPFIFAKYGYGEVEEAQYIANSINDVEKLIENIIKE